MSTQRPPGIPTDQFFADLFVLNPPSADEPPSPTDPPVDSLEAQTGLMQHGSAAVYLHAATNRILGGRVQPDAHYHYIDRVCAAEAVEDPIAKMMAEQLIWCHHAIGGLHVRAADAERFEESDVYMALVAKLMNEFRRTATALGDVGTPSLSETATHAAVPSKPAAPEYSREKNFDADTKSAADINGQSKQGELTSNGKLAKGHTNGKINRLAQTEEPPSNGSRAPKSTQARFAFAGGP